MSLLLCTTILAALASCNLQTQPPVTGPASATRPATSTTAPSSSPSQEQPSATAALTPTITPTPEPLALKVNGDGVTLAEYQAELSQIKEADAQQKKDVKPEDEKQQALDDLRDTALLAQAAYQNGFTMDDAALQARIDQIAQQRGGEQALKDWQAKYGYTEASFRTALLRSLAAAWQRDKIAATVPDPVEQVHARQILVQDEDTANNLENRVKANPAEFTNLAFGYDTLTGGDLGWFPRGYLLQPEVEEAAFSLQPGQVSPVVHSKVGYHIIQIIARETHPLSNDAKRVLQHKALETWLADQRQKSQVEVLVP